MAAEVVEACENAFFGNSEASGDDRLLETRVVFERIAEHLAYEVAHVGVVAEGSGFVKGNVVFVHENHDTAAVGFVKRIHKHLQAVAHEIFLRFGGQCFEAKEVCEIGFCAPFNFGAL